MTVGRPQSSRRPADESTDEPVSFARTPVPLTPIPQCRVHARRHLTLSLLQHVSTRVGGQHIEE